MRDEACIVFLTLKRELVAIDSRDRIYDETGCGRAAGEIDRTKREDINAKPDSFQDSKLPDDQDKQWPSDDQREIYNVQSPPLLVLHQVMASISLPLNVHVSTHPCVRAKLSQLRSKETNARDTKALLHEIALMVGCEALAACLENVPTGTVSL